MPTVLTVEDDRPGRKAIVYYLQGQGYRTLEAEDGHKALETAHLADVILLDIMLPVLDGWQVAQQLQEDHPGKPVIILTALGEIANRLQGFDLGADDYMTKPVDLHELGARIKALLRRVGYTELITQGDLEVSLDSRIACLNGEELDLTPLEFDVLATLIRHPGRVWSRSSLITAAWGYDYDGADRTVDVRMAHLRRKLGDDGRDAKYIRTIRGVGYQFLQQPAKTT